MASSITRLRRALLVALLLIVGGLVGLYLFGRSARSPRPPEAAGSDAPGQDVKVLGKGFEYKLEDQGRILFSIRGGSYQVNADETVAIDGMGVEVFSAEGDVYRVESSKAVYDPKTEEAQLLEGAKVHGPSGIEIETRALELTQKGNLIQSDDPVTFRYGQQLEGDADRLRLNLSERLYLLAGGVRIKSLSDAPAPFGLVARRLLVDRLRHHLRAEKDVDIRFDGHRVRARQVSVWMSEDEKTPILLRAKKEVRGRIASAAGGTEVGPVRFEGRQLAAYFEPATDRLSRIDLLGRNEEPAVVISQPKGELPRRLVAGQLAGLFVGGNLVKAEAIGGVRLAELPEAPPEEDWNRSEAGPEPLDGPESEAEAEEEDLQPISPETLVVDLSERPFDELEKRATRLATAPRAEAILSPDGQLVEVTLMGKVLVKDERFSARGTQARFDYANGLGEFVGQPATVVSPRGEMAAPRFLYTERTTLLYASGGTRTRLEQQPGRALLDAGPLGRGEGPVWVEAQEAFLRDSDRTFLFRGKVRAWRGENLLLSDELQGDEAGGQLVARGNVRTVWRPGGEASATNVPAETTADEMIYQRPNALLRYRGKVRSRQGERDLACDQMTVELDERQRAKRVLLDGKVEIQDRLTGRTLTGDHARYDVAGRTVEVEGERVVVREKGGGEVTGRRVVYELATGRVNVESTPSPPAPPSS
ncbi:MAG TPA: LPS export ABC transporter periplasmic protein LptC [Thermoanaerobaculia bacterium]|nr:LPS export ABC transporter periplasmic protein LptC [Thermoanaerobaculia bacterium]